MRLVNPGIECLAEVEHSEQQHHQERQHERELDQCRAFLLSQASFHVCQQMGRYGFDTDDMLELIWLRRPETFAPVACSTPIVRTATSPRISAYSISA